MSEIEAAEYFKEYSDVQKAFYTLEKLGLNMLTDEQQTNLLKLITKRKV